MTSHFTRILSIGLLYTSSALAAELGLPPVMSPEHNPTTDAKAALGARLFSDSRFSAQGDVSCASCHTPDNAFSDGPLQTSEGSAAIVSSRNAPSLLNVAYNTTQERDGRSASLEAQTATPFTSHSQMGLKDYAAILDIVRSEKAYRDAFYDVFSKTAAALTIDEVSMALAAYARSQVAGDSAFDRWRFGGQSAALTESQQRGFEIFMNEGNCASCHSIGEESALFTDQKFHNVGIGINALQRKVPQLSEELAQVKANGGSLAEAVLNDDNLSHLGRYAVDGKDSSIGAFRTPTLRNVSLTAPYMHDGSIDTLRGVVIHYNNGGVNIAGNRTNTWLSKQIKPLNLSDQQIDNLVAFMESLTSTRLITAQQ